MKTYDNSGKIPIFTELSILIDSCLEDKQRRDKDHKSMFNHPWLTAFNKRYAANPYSIDKYGLPIRFKEFGKRSLYGWILDENNDMININVDRKLILLDRDDIHAISYTYLLQKYARLCSAKSSFCKIMAIIEENRAKEMAAAEEEESEAEEFQSDANSEEPDSTEYSDIEEDVI